jgi:hypothetical protein
MGPDELGAYAKKEIDYWGKVIRTAGIKGEELKARSPNRRGSAAP